MIVPKSKKSRSKRGSRRAHDFLVPKGWSVCPETGESVPPHRVSPLGWYKGKKIFKTRDELRAEKKQA